MKLKPCPFCGLTSDTDWEDTLHPSGVGWCEDNSGYHDSHVHRFYLSTEHKDEWEGVCYEISCSVTYGGCGANISGDSKEEVIERWNRRT